MVSLPELWLPILLSAVAVFIASFIFNALLPHHRVDFRKLPDEDRVMAELRTLNLTAGEYVFPHAAGNAEMASEAYIQRRTAGPAGNLTVVKSGPVSMGGQLGGWFAFTLVVSLFAAYVAARTLAPGAAYMGVFRIAGAVAIAGYVLALWQQTIWFGRPWLSTLKYSVDGVVYGLLTAGVFGWLWP